MKGFLGSWVRTERSMFFQSKDPSYSKKLRRVVKTRYKIKRTMSARRACFFERIFMAKRDPGLSNGWVLRTLRAITTRPKPPLPEENGKILIARQLMVECSHLAS